MFSQKIKSKQSLFFRKLKTIKELEKIISKLKKQNKKIVTTNGVFDILHLGHTRYLEQSKKLGDILIVAVNSDKSTKRIKGIKRPLNSERHRAEMLACLSSVDYVTIFDENTPHKFLETIKPHVHTKGGDYKINEVIGREVVEKYQGRVVVIKKFGNHSTTRLMNKIAKLYANATFGQ
jgi:glycerol-3-phosphate cytidylyltransferase